MTEEQGAALEAASSDATELPESTSQMAVVEDDVAAPDLDARLARLLEERPRNLVALWTETDASSSLTKARGAIDGRSSCSAAARAAGSPRRSVAARAVNVCRVSRPRLARFVSLHPNLRGRCRAARRFRPP
jgi:hypothetical protein